MWEHDGAGHRSFFEEQDFWPNVREWGELENEGAAVLPKFLEVGGCAGAVCIACPPG